MVENELQFVSWPEFQEMVPSIVQLEISRLERVIGEVRDQTELCTALMEARSELQEFSTALQEAEKETLESSCAPHLEAALLTLSVQADGADEETAETLHYIVDRLNHVHDRMELTY